MLYLENDSLKVSFFEDNPFPVEVINKLAGTSTVFCGQRLMLRLENDTEFIIDHSNRCHSLSGGEAQVDFIAEREGLLVQVCCKLSGTELSLQTSVENRMSQSIYLQFVDLFRAFANCKATKQTINGDASLGDVGLADLDLQQLVEAYPIFLNTGLYCGIDWPVAQNETIGGEIVCRQYLGDILAPGERCITRILTIGAAHQGNTAEAFLEHLKRLRGRDTRRASFYFDWLTHASEGITEAEMGVQLDMLERLKKEFDIGFDIYAVDDGIVETRWNLTYDTYRLQQDCLFENGLKAQADRCAQMGMDFGIWLGPDGFGHSEAEAKRRMEDVCNMLHKWNVGLIKMDVCVSPALNDDPYHNEKYMRNLEELIQKLREIRPDLIVINHRITNSPYILGILDSTLWQGAECYPDVFMFNGDKPRLFTRYASYSRGKPSYFGAYSELLEDHGICFNGFYNGWEHEFVIQAFGRALMLSPEVYGCLFMLPDEAYERMGQLQKLSKEKSSILAYGRYVEETGDFIHSDGESTLLCIINDSWEKKIRKISINEQLGLMPMHSNYEVKCIYPQNADKIVMAACGEELTVNLHPFAVCLLEFTPCGSTKTADGNKCISTPFLTLDQHKMELCAKYIQGFVPMEPTNSDLAFSERIRFLISSDPMEIQAIQRIAESRIEEVNICRKLFYGKLKLESMGVASNAWDDDCSTVWSDQPYWKDSSNVWRLDLGRDYAVERIEVQLSNIRPGPVCEMEYGRELEEPILFEISQDALHWTTTKAVIFYKRFPTETHVFADKLIAEFDPTSAGARYVRMHLKGVLVSDICVRERVNNRLLVVDRSSWHGNNLLTSRPPRAVYQAKFHMEEVFPNQYLAVTVSLKSSEKISLNQEVAVGWLEGDEDIRWPIVDASPIFPAKRWECDTSLHGNAAWTFWIPVTDTMQRQELTIKLAWYGLEKGNEYLYEQEPEIHAHLVIQ